MADLFTTQWQFDEVRLAGDGLMAYGIATLEGDEDGFWVTEIVLDGGLRLVRSGAGYGGVPDPALKLFFRLISQVIEADPEVEREFMDRLEGETETIFRPDTSEHGTYSAVNGRVS